MTKRVGAGFFPRWRMAAGFAAVVFIQLPACSSVPEVASAPPSGLSSGQPTDSGTFPNLNIPPQSAAAQITPEQKAEKFSELKAAQAAQSSPPGGGVTANQSQLKKIAATHAAEALAEIEGQ